MIPPLWWSWLRRRTAMIDAEREAERQWIKDWAERRLS